MTDVADVATRPRRGRRLALAASGVAAAALLVPALGADALSVEGTFTGGPSQVVPGDTVTLTATNCFANVVAGADAAPQAAPQAVVQFTVSIDGGAPDTSPPFPADESGTVTFSGPLDANTPPGTYVFHAICGWSDGTDVTKIYDYDQTVTITVLGATTTTTAPSTTSTTARPPSTTPIAVAARAAAATPRFTG